MKSSKPSIIASKPSLHKKMVNQAIATLFSGIVGMTPHAQQAWAQESQDVKTEYRIAAGSLQEVLATYTVANKMILSADPALLAGKHSLGLHGSFSKREGLEELLKGTGLNLMSNPQGDYSLYKSSPSVPVSRGNSSPASAVQLQEVEVRALRPDEEGKLAVYRQSMSSIHLDDTNFTKFKGSNVADIFRGQVGVYSGDARNGDVLDPNIRGMQGQGRIPLTIDGTEQSITRSKGYYVGTNNANYIDPNLIAGGTIIKGAAIDRNVATSSGGGIALRTIGAQDILKPGQRFGVRLKIDGETNTTSPRFPDTVAEGQIYNINGSQAFQVEQGFAQQYSTKVTPHDSPTLLNSKSGSTMAAVAWQNEDFNLLAAYSYRKRGNYYAGRHGAEKYQNAGMYQQAIPEEYSSNTPVAEFYKPGKEVTNTSNEAESFLTKGEWHINDDMMLGLGLRFTEMHTGGITPSAIRGITREQMVEGQVFQWPEAKSRQKGYNLDYVWKPENSRLVDLQAKLWRTETNSDDFTGRGVLNGVIPIIPEQRYVTAQSNKLDIQNDRTGFSISNKFQIHETLSLLIGGNYQSEKLDVDARWSGNVRSGLRHENDIYFNFNWQPLKWVEFDAGAKRRAFSMKDKGHLSFLNTNVAQAGERETPLIAELVTVKFKPGRDFWMEIFEAQIDGKLDFRGSTTSEYAEASEKAAVLGMLTSPSTDTLGFWLPLDASGKLTGDPSGITQEKLDAAFGGAIKMEDLDLSTLSHQNAGLYLRDANRPPADGKTKDTDWVPSFGVTFKGFHTRLYWRYAQDIRMPSIAEGTHGGYISNLYNRDYYGFDPLQPERSKNVEIGLSHDFSRFFATGTVADAKLAYFDQTTKDVIDTVLMPRGFVSANLDQQKLRGIEFQSRFDDGRIFADFSATKNLKNQVCDKTEAIRYSSYVGEIPNCVNYGFPHGGLLNMKQPKYSLNLLLGRRFFDNKLEIGSRVSYFTVYDRQTSYTRTRTNLIGLPVNWSSTTIVDAYANYQISSKVALEFSAMNLTDRYYVDPLARSWMPAPGRTLRLGLKIDL